jgi:phage tail sheath gpL-like
MTASSITFTRVPGIKIPVVVNNSGLVSADNTLIIVGRKAATGGSALAGSLTQISNYGDPVAAATECTTLFGASSEAGEMVVAAINAILYSGLDDVQYPPIKVLALASTAVSTDLAAIFANYLSTPFPYIVLPFEATDSTAMTALKNHLTAINGNDRGDNGQFGSFGFLALNATTATATPIGVSAASQSILIPWLLDTAGTKANKVYNLAAAFAAVCASLAVPYLPLDGVKIGKINAPATASDWHTSGDTGTIALGLSAGLSPLQVNSSGDVVISRSVTTVRTVSSSEDAAYYDLQDWQVLYYLRKQIYNLALQPRYKRAKASSAKLQSLKSEMIQICKTMESLEMLQQVDKLAANFTVARSVLNRHAAVYSVPVNVIPGFHNKGIEIDAGTSYDVVVA